MRRHYLIGLLLIVIVSAVFWQAQYHDFVWDDEPNVKDNPYLNPPTLPNVLHFWQEPYERLYVPLTYTLWAAIAPFARTAAGFGDGAKLDPRSFHVANLFLHVLSTLVVFALLRMLARHDWAACAGALLFALHPVQVEPVAWVTGMKDVLGGFLSLVAVWQYLSYARATSSADGSVGKRDKKSSAETHGSKLKRNALLHYSLATLAFLLALLAKPTAVVVPVVTWVLDYWVPKRSMRQSAVALAGWMAIAMPVIVVTKWAQPDAEIDFITPLWARPLVAADTVAFYLYKLVLPLWLAPDYGRLPDLVLRQGWVYFTWVVPCALAVLLWIWKDRRPWLVVSTAIFVLGVLPVSGLVPFSFQNTSTVADRYLYFSILGPALGLAWVLAQSRGTWVLTVCVLILAFLGIGSAFQTRYWHDNITLFSYALRLNSRSWTAHYNLARALAQQGKPDDAIAHYREAVRVKPEFADAHFSLGVLLATQGELDAAIDEYRRALQIAPGFVDAYYGLANALAMRGDLDAAVDSYHEALKLNPRRSEIYFSLANVWVKKGRLDEAIESLDQAVRINPDFALAQNTLGRLIAAQGDLDKAIEHFRQALRIQPNFAEAHESLAMALAQQGRRDEAAQHYQEALRIMRSRHQAGAER